MPYLLPSCVLMIRPNYFAFNPGTAQSNKFQQELPGLAPDEIRLLALEEFDNLVSLLEAWDVEVLLFNDTPIPHKPDALFPNNWFSTHLNGWLITYPMLDPARRTEQREDIIQNLINRYGYIHRNDLKKLEEEEIFLEGTGSLVLDREYKIAYAALSPRTNPEALDAWAKLMGFKMVVFNAFGPEEEPIYHTNVMMCIGDNFALLGTDCIAANDRQRVLDSLEKSGKRVIELSKTQVCENFAGNMLALCNRQRERLLLMSTTAKRSLSPEQIHILTEELSLGLVAAPLSIIETVGGGGVRCMLAEIVIPQ
jgi:hypothetical protein